MAKFSQSSNFLDITGVFLSILCAIHCTVGPLLILFVPALGGVFGSESFHLGLFLAIVPVAGFTFISCYKKHRSKGTLALAMTAIFFLFCGLVFGEYSEFAEHGLTLAGSVMIVIAHILNIRHCRCLKNPGAGSCH
jgi:hypothetical protein